jgi:hypothetical protein
MMSGRQRLAGDQLRKRVRNLTPGRQNRLDELLHRANAAWPAHHIRHCDNIAGMPWGEVELEPEVQDWLENLDDQRWAQAVFHLDLLEERGALLGEPYTRQLAGKLRELRFYCGGQRVRISYWIASGRRIVMLTVFTKTRMRETAEIGRAGAAMARCQQEGHTADGEG